MTSVDIDPTLNHTDNSETRTHEILTVEETFQRYFPALVHHAKKFGVRDPEATVMDVFERAVKEKERKGPDVLLHPGWYFWVTHNLAVNELRSLTCRQKTLVDMDWGDPDNREESLDPASGDAFGNVEFDETMQQVDRVLADKPQHWKAVLVRHALNGDRHREISQELGIPEGTVASSLMRAKIALRADDEFRSAVGRE